MVRTGQNKARCEPEEERKEEKERRSYDKIPIDWLSQKTTD